MNIIEIVFYTDDYNFYVRNANIFDTIGNFLRKVNEDLQTNFHSVYLKGKQLESLETFNNLIEDLQYNAFFLTNDPCFDLNLKEMRIDLNNYQIIEEIQCSNYNHMLKAIDIRTNKNVVLRFFSSFQINRSYGFLIFSKFNLPGTVKIHGYKFFLNEEEKNRFNIESDSSFVVVSDYIPNGSIKNKMREYIQSNGRINARMNPTIKSKIIFGVASIIKQLNQKKYFLRNISIIDDFFLDENLEPIIVKYSSVGFKKGIDELEVSPIASPLYIAPEVFSDEGEYGTQSNVYSFAIFLYQMFSTTNNLMLDDGRGRIRSPQNLMMRIYKGARLIRPQNIPDHYWELIVNCWSNDQYKRPTITNIVKYLRDDIFALEEFGIYTNLDELHEYQNQIDVDDEHKIALLEEENAKLKRRVNSMLRQQTRESMNFSFIDSETIQSFRTIREIDSNNNNSVIEIAKEERYILKICTSIDFNDLRNFISLYESLNRCQHPNIVKTFGINLGNETQSPSILLEYCPSNLINEIRNPINSQLDITKWIYEIVDTMNFIHKKGILHRNLKPSSILIGKDSEIRITNFGTFPNNDEDGNYNEKSDVYSFGILLYFMLNEGNMPTDEIMQFENHQGLTDLANEILNLCWRNEQSERPKFDRILEIFDQYNYRIFELNEYEIREIHSFVNAHREKTPMII